ncbi:SseB family protein [Actinoplanes sp. CA-030573]|uniref:SseB family protein n=1 Tax=Actinoplanes sp. CA-030573 TaxID=3239898 RepID=UPI003D8A7EF3
MSEWEPATDAEVAMRDALRTDDQESYFRILAGVDLLLPVSADALQGLSPLGWGTWSTGGRTHVLAFTSPAAMQSCLADYNGSARRVPYGELANTWPNLEWWLAVNPGLPIEGYLPAWFVAQLSRGDLRLPTRGPGREKPPSPARIQDLHSAAMAANAAVAKKDEAAAQQPASSPAAAAPPASSPAASQPVNSPAAAQQPGSSPAAAQQPGSSPAAVPQPAGYPQPTGFPASAAAGFPASAAAGFPASAAAGFPASAAAGFPASAAAGYPQPTSAPPAGIPAAAAAGYPQPTSAPPTTSPAPSFSASTLSGAPAGYAQAAAASRMPQMPAADEPQPDAASAPASAPPAPGHPTSGPPAPGRLASAPAATAGPASAPPAASASAPPAASASAPPAASASAPPFGATRPASAPPSGAAWPTSAPPAASRPASAPPAPARPGSTPPPPYGAQSPAAQGAPQIGPGGLPIRTPGAVMPSGLPSRTPTSATPGSASPTSAAPASGPTGFAGPGPVVPAPAALPVPPAYRPPSIPGDAAGGWPGSVPGGDPRGPLQDPNGPLPVRTPMANTPPVPEHLAGSPAEQPYDPRLGVPSAPALPELPHRHSPQDEAARGGFGPDAAGRGGFPAGDAAGGGFPQGPASPQAAGAQRGTDQPAPGFGTPLPRRQAAASAEPAPMTSFPAFKTPAERAATAAAQAAAPAAPGASGAPEGPAAPGVPATPNAPFAPGTPAGPAAYGAAAGPAAYGAAAGPAAHEVPAGPAAYGAAAGPAAYGAAAGPAAHEVPAGPAPYGAPAGPAPYGAPGGPAAYGAQAGSAAPVAPGAGRAGLAPPVIPGAPGSDRPARLGATPPLEVRGAAAPVAAAGVRPGGPAAPPPPAEPVGEPFVPANDVERDLLDAAGAHSTDQFLSTLLLATVLVPVAHHSRPGSAPGESGFAFRTEDAEGERFLVVFTSKDRLAEHFAEPTRTVSVRFYELIRNWPDPEWSFAVNPGTPVGAKYPGPQVIALASWAAEAGLDPEHGDEPGEPVPAPAPANDDAQHATVMQKTVPPEQVDFYLERGYDRVAGFVHRATEVEHLRTPGELFGALGLTYEGSPHQGDAKEAYVLRWPAYRPSLYRIPYGGQNEQALKAMDGWVIERAPFRGNGFAPGEGRDVIAEFKVDSVRLPHGAQLWRIDADGSEHMVAIFDNDGPQWRRVGEQ